MEWDIIRTTVGVRVSEKVCGDLGLMSGCKGLLLQGVDVKLLSVRDLLAESIALQTKFRYDRVVFEIKRFLVGFWRSEWAAGGVDGGSSAYDCQVQMKDNV